MWCLEVQNWEKKTKLNGCVCNDLAIANQTSCRNVTHVEVHKDNNGNFKKLGGWNS